MQIRVSWPTHTRRPHLGMTPLTEEQQAERSEGYLVAIYHPGHGQGGTCGVVLEDSNPTLQEIPIHRLAVDNDRSFLDRGVVSPAQFGPRRINR